MGKNLEKKINEMTNYNDVDNIIAAIMLGSGFIMGTVGRTFESPFFAAIVFMLCASYKQPIANKKEDLKKAALHTLSYATGATLPFIDQIYQYAYEHNQEICDYFKF